MNCTTVADCASLIIPNITDWCIEELSCDTKYHTCITWPRCRNLPLFGCLNQQQKCVSTRVETDPDTTPSPWGYPSYVLVFTFGLLFVIFVAIATGRYAYKTYNNIVRHMAEKRKLTHIPGPDIYPPSIDHMSSQITNSF